MNTQNRWSSKVLWTAIFAQIISLCQITGVFEAIGLDVGLVGDVVAGVLQLFVLVGVLNNPTDKQDW